MSVPKYDDLFNPVLEALHELAGSASISEMEDSVAKILKLSEEDLNEIHKGSTTKFSYRLAWARNYLKKYGLIENSSRGVWSLTETGRKTKSVDKKVVKNAVSKNLSLNKSTVSEQDELVGETANEQELTSWKDNVIEIIKSIHPDAFERLCMRLLRESGFTHVEITGKSGDGGIDGKGVVKIGGLLSFHVVFQCKRYKDSVSSPVIRDFRGAMVGRADKGLIITTGVFTRDAKVEANRDGASPIDLIDGEKLAEKLKELKLGITVTERIIEDINIKKEWFENL